MGEESIQAILGAVIEATDDVVVVKDLDGRYLLANPAMAQLCGRSVDELVGRTVADLFPHHVAQPLMEADRQALESGQSLTVEEHVPVGDETRIYLSRKIPYRDSEGKIVGLVAIGRDITERVRAGEALRARVKELNCLYGISALVEQPGVSLAEILQGAAELIPPAWQYPEITAARISLEDREFRTANFREGCPWQQVADLVVRGQHQGRVEVCYLEERPERDEGPFLKEERTLLQAVAERLGRVVERIRAERVLQESEARLQVLTASTPAYIFELDASGTIRFANRTIPGLTREQVVGTSLLDWVPEAQRSGIQALLDRTFALGQPQSIEYTIPNPQGELRSYAAQVLPVLTGDRVSAAVLTATDISERVRAEEVLQEAHSDLERRVRERTAALEEVNTILEKEVVHRREVQEELLRVNRAQQMLIRCNEAVLRATGEAGLVHEICELVVGVGGYRLAWAGFALQDEAKTVRPVAQAGFEEGYLDTLDITWADSDRGRGPTGTAIRTGRPAPSRNILTDPCFAPWRAEATRRGYASSLALPLKALGQTLGSLNIYAAEADAFDTQETQLLSELADNVTFGIVALRTRAKRQRAEEALQQRAEELSALHAVGHRVSGSLSLEEVVQAALDGIAEAAAPDLVLLYLRLGDELHLQGVHAVEDRHRSTGPEVKRVGECLCGLAVSEGRPFYSRDIALDPLCTLQECKQAGMHSFAALPLLQGAEVFGVLGLASMAERVFAEQATVLEALAGEITIGLQNALLYQQVQRQTADLEQQVAERRLAQGQLAAKAGELARSNAFLSALNQVAARIQSAPEHGEILEALGVELWALGLVSVVALLEADDSALVIRHISAPPEILARAEELIGTQFCGQRLRHDVWPASETLQDVQAVYVPDPRAVMAGLLPHLSHTPLWRAARRAGVSADYRAICVPLAYEDRVLGVLAVMGSDLQEGAAPALSVFASQVAAAFERVRLTKEAAEAEILREVDRLRSELIANVSHEIRTPLGLIEIFGTSLLMEDVELDTETQRQFLSGIHEETVRLTALVDNLLNLSQMESGRYRLDRHLVDLGQLASEVLATLEIQVVDHRLEHDFPPAPLVAGADAKQIEQVLRNLLSNAIRYSPQGGTITVQGYRAAGRVVLSVRDEGIGIPAEEQERIFERFYRVDTELAGKVSGVGLGLAVCQGIVEGHGGRLWVESDPGQGSRFYFTLPL